MPLPPMSSIAASWSASVCRASSRIKSAMTGSAIMLHPQLCRSLEHGGFYFFGVRSGRRSMQQLFAPPRLLVSSASCDRVSIVIAAQFDVSRSHRARAHPIAIPKRAFRMMPRTNHKSG